MDTYYTVLGIQKNASLEDIKKAYRTKAKLLHPDRNKNPDSHEQFILLNEAYEYLQNLKTGKNYNPVKRSYTASPRNRKSYEEWKKEEREKTRARAQHYAKMKYEEFIKTDYYRSVASLEIIASHLEFFLSIVVVVIFPLVAMILYGVNGLGAGLLLNFLLLPGTVKSIRNPPQLNAGTFVDSVLHIVRTNTFLITSFTAVNIFIILKFGLQTLIPPLLLLIAYGVVIALVFFFCWLRDEKFKTYFYSFGVGPMILNAFVIINFIFSFDPVQETYSFRKDIQSVSTRRGSERQASTYIYLENSAYDEYPGIRMFLDYEAMKYRNYVTYTFKKGILGIRVMTDYQFGYR